MKAPRLLLLFCCVLLVLQNVNAAQPRDYKREFEKLVKLQKEVADIHPAIENLYPVALVEDNHFYLYDYLEEKGSYVFIEKVKSDFPLSKGIRASFPLNFYDNKTACVVSDEIFDDLDGYSILLHEFVHCYQANTAEYELKEGLTIYKNAMKNEQYSWELEYDFHYQDKEFVELYRELLTNIEEDNPAGVFRIRAKIRDVLGENDYEYMVWQEWKEGSARHIENRIRKRLNLDINDSGKDEPYSRVTFYYAGDKYIDILARFKPGIISDLKQLFTAMYGKKEENRKARTS